METDVIKTASSIQPLILERACGGFLALSPEDAALRIGVLGETAEEARLNFTAALARWTELLQDAN